MITNIHILQFNTVINRRYHLSKSFEEIQMESTNN